jgi:hypothetical protein
LEEIIANLAQKSLVDGAFLYLLYHFVTRFSATQDTIVTKMGEISNTLTDVSNTLATLDERVRKLEGEKE